MGSTMKLLRGGKLSKQEYKHARNFVIFAAAAIAIAAASFSPEAIPHVTRMGTDFAKWFMEERRSQLPDWFPDAHGASVLAADSIKIKDKNGEMRAKFVSWMTTEFQEFLKIHAGEDKITPPNKLVGE
jgi:hypothetical protein